MNPELGPAISYVISPKVIEKITNYEVLDKSIRYMGISGGIS